MHDDSKTPRSGKNLRIALALSLALVAATSSFAQTITTFNNLGAFNTALGAAPVTVESFTSTSHFPIPSGVLNSLTNLPGIGIFPGTIQPGVTYSTPTPPDSSSNYFNPRVDVRAGQQRFLAAAERHATEQE